jgi:hypothetical protein
MSDIKIYKSDIRDFIGIFDTDFDGDFLIKTFHNLKDINKTFDRNFLEEKKDIEDEAYSATAEIKESYEVDTMILRSYNDLVSLCMKEYAKHYTMLQQIPCIQFSANIQKTSKCQGYHVFHWENGTYTSTHRHLATMVYLNDVLDGGETEFLYQSRRIKPRAGRVVIFPVAWTHTHRGNPPLSGDKYIATGWLYHRNP